MNGSANHGSSATISKQQYYFLYLVTNVIYPRLFHPHMATSPRPKNGIFKIESLYGRDEFRKPLNG